ncbi:hypothetical protein BaRGS_00039170 [Batillaria attramentaria]|uniref:Uncharacterized protein n=1 Tax=Batillaria attramentaria TaxID=370345 RepID=A0ABD0J476_9CAEN
MLTADQYPNCSRLIVSVLCTAECRQCARKEREEGKVHVSRVFVCHRVECRVCSHLAVCSSLPCLVRFPLFPMGFSAANTLRKKEFRNSFVTVYHGLTAANIGTEVSLGLGVLDGCRLTVAVAGACQRSANHFHLTFHLLKSICLLSGSSPQ